MKWLRGGRGASLLPIAALSFTALLNVHHLAWWCLPLLGLAMAWHLRAVLRGFPQPGRVARIGFALLVTAGVALSFHTLNGLSAGATLLGAMTAAKLFEARSRRDWYVISGATLFLLLAACLDRQQLWRFPLYAISLWLVAASLRSLSGGAPIPVPTLLRESARQLLYAVPLAIVCFLFFPRLPGAFWAIASDDEAITGLSDEMSPGRIARLAESEEPALRARFEGPLPPARQRYWRGPVLHDFDGYTWRRHRGFGGGGNAGAGPATPALVYAGPAYRYSETLEPNSHGTVVALELSVPPGDPSITQSADYQLISRRPILQPRSYDLVAYPQAVDRDALSDEARRVDLALPGDRNPRTRALAGKLRAQSADDAAFVERVLGFLRDGGFEYTLTPQQLGRNATDELLFQTRQGFCGHYASAFVDLMRAGGVPARVVTGYQGGEWNPFGRFLLVRQKDAHAWAEVWLPGRGWVRTDPTAVIAPDRLSRESLQFGDGFGSSSSSLRSPPWLASTLQAWDALNAWWQDDIVNFNFARQLNLAERLGFGDRDWQTLATAMGTGLCAWLAWIAWSLRRMARAARPDALAVAWRRVEKRASGMGLPRAPHEGVLAWCERIAPLQPAQAQLLQPLARRYAVLRYGPPATPSDLQAFIRTARAFRPAPA